MSDLERENIDDKCTNNNAIPCDDSKSSSSCSEEGDDIHQLTVEEETYFKFVKSVFFDDDIFSGCSNPTDEDDDENYEPDAKDDNDDDENDSDDDSDDDDEDLIRVQNRELRELVDGCWQTIVGEAPHFANNNIIDTEKGDNKLADTDDLSDSITKPAPLSTHLKSASIPFEEEDMNDDNDDNGDDEYDFEDEQQDSKGYEDEELEVNIANNPTNTNHTSIPSKSGKSGIIHPGIGQNPISSMVVKLFSGSDPSNVCVNGIPLQAMRNLVARQLSMATQLLIQVLLQADERSECFTKGYTSLMELSNLRETAMKKATLIQMNVNNAESIKNQMLLCGKIATSDDLEEEEESSNSSLLYESQLQQQKSLHPYMHSNMAVMQMNHPQQLYHHPIATNHNQLINNNSNFYNSRMSSSNTSNINSNIHAVDKNNTNVLERRLTRSLASSGLATAIGYSVFDVPVLSKISSLFMMIDQSRQVMSFEQRQQQMSYHGVIKSIDKSFLLSQIKQQINVIMPQLNMLVWNSLIPTINYPLPQALVLSVNPSSLTARCLFTPAEDDLLLRGIIQYRNSSNTEQFDWDAIRSEYVPTKETQLLQYRYTQMTSLLNASPSMEENNFKRYQRLELDYKVRDEMKWIHEEELDLLRGFYLFGDRWALIKIFFLPHKTSHQIKYRWNSLTKIWQKAYQGGMKSAKTFGFHKPPTKMIELNPSLIPFLSELIPMSPVLASTSSALLQSINDAPILNTIDTTNSDNIITTANTAIDNPIENSMITQDNDDVIVIDSNNYTNAKIEIPEYEAIEDQMNSRNYPVDINHNNFNNNIINSHSSYMNEHNNYGLNNNHNRQLVHNNTNLVGNSMIVFHDINNNMPIQQSWPNPNLSVIPIQHQNLTMPPPAPMIKPSNFNIGPALLIETSGPKYAKERKSHRGFYSEVLKSMTNKSTPLTTSSTSTSVKTALTASTTSPINIENSSMTTINKPLLMNTNATVDLQNRNTSRPGSNTNHFPSVPSARLNMSLLDSRKPSPNILGGESIINRDHHSRAPSSMNTSSINNRYSNGSSDSIHENKHYQYLPIESDSLLSLLNATDSFEYIQQEIALNTSINEENIFGGGGAVEQVGMSNHHHHHHLTNTKDQTSHNNKGLFSFVQNNIPESTVHSNNNTNNATSANTTSSSITTTNNDNNSNNNNSKTTSDSASIINNKNTKSCRKKTIKPTLIAASRSDLENQSQYSSRSSPTTMERNKILETFSQNDNITINNNNHKSPIISENNNFSFFNSLLTSSSSTSTSAVNNLTSSSYSDQSNINNTNSNAMNKHIITQSNDIDNGNSLLGLDELSCLQGGDWLNNDWTQLQKTQHEGSFIPLNTDIPSSNPSYNPNPHDLIQNNLYIQDSACEHSLLLPDVSILDNSKMIQFISNEQLDNNDNNSNNNNNNKNDHQLISQNSKPNKPIDTIIPNNHSNVDVIANNDIIKDENVQDIYNELFTTNSYDIGITQNGFSNITQMISLLKSPPNTYNNTDMKKNGIQITNALNKNDLTVNNISQSPTSVFEDIFTNNTNTTIDSMEPLNKKQKLGIFATVMASSHSTTTT